MSLPSPTARQCAQEAHFIRRVRERFGLKLSPERYRRWIAKVEEVQEGTRFLYACEQQGRTAWSIRAGGYIVRVIYDETTQRLVTALPIDASETATLGRKKILRLRARVPLDRDHLAKQRRLRRGK